MVTMVWVCQLVCPCWLGLGKGVIDGVVIKKLEAVHSLGIISLLLMEVHGYSALLQSSVFPPSLNQFFSSPHFWSHL